MNYQSRLQLLVQTWGQERIKFDEKLADHTFSKLGGPAEAFFVATNESELVKMLDMIDELKVPYLMLGAGTKSVFSDRGVNGLVIKNRTSITRVVGIKGKVGKGNIGIDTATIEVSSGVSLGKLNEFLKEQGLEQINFETSEIATVGSSVFIDQNLRLVVEKVRIWEQREVEEVGLPELNRHRQVVLSVIIRVKAASI